MNDPILTPTPARFTMFPIKEPEIWEMYKKQLECFWQTNEINLSQDMEDWVKLTKDEQNYISMILAFFAASDGLVIENLGVRFMCDVQLAEARAFYAIQIAIETIHSQTYSLLIDTYIKDLNRRDELFNAILRFECIAKKAAWAEKWINSNECFSSRLIAFACIEGIFFSGAFCSIYWLKKRGLMKGLVFSNELISRDEALHTEFAALLYSKLVQKISQEEIHTIIKECVEIETYFTNVSLPCKMIGMNSNLMTHYIQFVADRLCIQLGTDKIYNVENPFDWMVYISIDRKTNMFEGQISEYALADEPMPQTLDFDDEF